MSDVLSLLGALVVLSLFLDLALAFGTPVASLTFWLRNREVTAVREGPGLRGAAALYYWPARKVGRLKPPYAIA
jgi:hypothetical protein